MEVTLLHICDNPDILRVMKLVRTVFDLIRFAVPIILIISLMWQYVRVIMSSKDELVSANSLMVKKIIAAVLVFMIPTFITLLIDVAGNQDIGYSTCFSNATNEKITEAYISQAQKYIAKANKTLNKSDYNKAVSEVNNSKNQLKKVNNTDKLSVITQFEEELDILKTKIDNKEEELRKINKERVNEYLEKSKSGYVWPIYEVGSLTACFNGDDSVHKALGGHGAIDIAVPSNTPVYAIQAGKVISSNYPGNYPSTNKSNSEVINNCSALGGCANKVVIEHSNGVTSTYCHLYTGSITVKEGQYVKQGQQIGQVGSSGCSTAPHLHLAMKDGGSAVDPLNYLSPNVTNPGRCK